MIKIGISKLVNMVITMYSLNNIDFESAKRVLRGLRGILMRLIENLMLFNF